MKALQHVSAISLFVEDLPAAKAFYAAVFAAPAVFEDAESASVRFDNLIINLLRVDAAHELIAPEKVGAAGAGARCQLSVWVDDVAAVAHALRERGIACHGPIDRPWGMRTVNFVDPAGHNWEVAQRIGTA